ncbi:disease resistance protein RPV1-like isoform X2 [Syzygium oleosum]|uniref:disease resistance protein RPV1-like isoform X2 n=1 Tax=Syzygium oleosum TaxID=219896 RepID=UPI0024BB651D|nr:disease resistance protein RPV1-like isoform X2 [Syzygium oleosum]
MDNHVDEIMELIGEQTTETKIVGIHGMGGVGKTTLATIIYNKLLVDFTNCCFLSNFKDTKIEILQNQLISGILKETCLPIRHRAEGITEIKKRLSFRKVILLLDDVVQKAQLDALVGMGKCWFGKGSKVIITTRNKEVLKDVELKYELTEMDFDHSLQLFSKHAFREDHPPAEYVPLSEKAVKICGHLPLALEIIGSFLARNDKKFWETTLEKLETIPDENVEEKLKISIEALLPRAKEIFLDVCCFFIGYDVRIVSHMWESCGFSPDYYLGVLQRTSLIKITERNRLWMHDLLRDLGRDFVCQNGNFKPEKQSRVWDHEQANDVLIAKGKKKVEAIRLKFDHQFQDFIEKEESETLSNLRFLQVDCVDLDENNVQHFPSTNWFQRNLLILPKLRFLSWHEFPLFFQLTAFFLMKLVILDLSRSEITNDWEGWNHLKMAKNLKVLNLTECRNLRRTPDFSAHENLVQLILRGCKELVQVDRSIGKLKHLVLLNLEDCEKLRTLPDEMEELEALIELLVDWTSITKIPEWKGMKKLETLSAVACKSLSICNFAGCLTSLLNLRLEDTEITELPFGNFGSLVELDLTRSNIKDLPNSIEKMKNLRVLRMSYTRLEKLPSALGMLEKLEEIDASGCGNLCGEIPSEIGRLSFLRILRLTSTGISNIPKLPKSMTNLDLKYNPHMRCPDLSNLLNLRVLELDLRSRSLFLGAPTLNWIGGLRKLESLLLCCDRLATLPSDLNLLSKLRKLVLIVDKLECLPMLPQNLSYFRIQGHRLMEKSIDVSYLEKLSELHVSYCKQLTEIQGLGGNLKRLHLDHLPSLVELPNLTNLKKLRVLLISGCPKLVEVRGQLESLKELHLMYCESLEKLPDPLSFKYIEKLDIYGCCELKEIQGLEDSENLSFLRLGDLPLLEKLPNLTNSKELKQLSLVLCPRLVEIQGRLESLKLLHIDCCRSLGKLSDPSSFKKLILLEIDECEKFEETLESDEYSDLRNVRRDIN